jgi:glycerol-3-phosphate dehydrogenase (NAD(P)+)
MKISILGYGTFGQSLGIYLERLGYEIIKEDITEDTEIIFVTVPSVNVLDVLIKFKDKLDNKKIIICSKGLSFNGELISVAIENDLFLKNFVNNIFFFYGPTMAEGLKNGEISGAVLSGRDGKDEIKNILKSDYLRIELSEDIVGSQIGAALKNVMSLFLGMCEGASLGDNTKAYIFTKCVEEVASIAESLGGKNKTIFGLSCMGDLTLVSRSRNIGIRIGRGDKLEDILKETNYTIESLNTLKNIKILLDKNSIKAPIIESIYSIVYENMSIVESVRGIK